MNICFRIEDDLTHFTRDTLREISDIFENTFINIGNIDKCFNESCSEGPDNQLALNLFIQLWAGFNEASP